MGEPGLYSLGLVLATVVVAGAIAFVGDWVGRMAGRRHLSLFGLRPRHTSVMVAVVTGILIAGASLALMAGVSGEVRLALFRIDEIQRALAQNRHELAALQKALADQRALLEQASRARDEALARSEAALRERERAEAELRQAGQHLTRVQQELAGARGQLAEARSRLQETGRDLEFQVARVAQLKELGEVLAQRVEGLQAQVASLERRQRELSETVIALWSTAQRLQYGSVAYQRDEIVLAAVIDAGGDRASAQTALLSFLRQVDAAAASQMGAEADREEGVVRIRPSVFDEAVELLTSGSGPWVVRARAVRNTLVNEPLEIFFELVPRGLAYHKGQPVAETLIEGTDAPAEDRVLDLLRTVNERAITHGGMVSGPDGTVGKLLSADEFVRVLNEIREASGPVRLVARAAADTYNTEGPLRIELRVERIEGT